MVASSLTNTWSDGPAVSLNGSPTVSPTTVAACSGVFFIFSSVSTIFLALSHAPPALAMKIAW